MQYQDFEFIANLVTETGMIARLIHDGQEDAFAVFATQRASDDSFDAQLIFADRPGLIQMEHLTWISGHLSVMMRSHYEANLRNLQVFVQCDGSIENDPREQSMRISMNGLEQSFCLTIKGLSPENFEKKAFEESNYSPVATVACILDAPSTTIGLILEDPSFYHEPHKTEFLHWLSNTMQWQYPPNVAYCFCARRVASLEAVA